MVGVTSAIDNHFHFPSHDRPVFIDAILDVDDLRESVQAIDKTLLPGITTLTGLPVFNVMSTANRSGLPTMPNMPPK